MAVSFKPMSAFEQSFPEHVRLQWAQISRDLGGPKAD
jgi:hypothetical protein